MKKIIIYLCFVVYLFAKPICTQKENNFICYDKNLNVSYKCFGVLEISGERQKECYCVNFRSDNSNINSYNPSYNKTVFTRYKSKAFNDYKVYNKRKKIKRNNKQYKCGEKKYCSQMSSCDEAYFYLNKCGIKSLDRDKDGIPCESLCK